MSSKVAKCTVFRLSPEEACATQSNSITGVRRNERCARHRCNKLLVAKKATGCFQECFPLVERASSSQPIMPRVICRYSSSMHC